MSLKRFIGKYVCYKTSSLGNYIFFKQLEVNFKYFKANIFSLLTRSLGATCHLIYKKLNSFKLLVFPNDSGRISPTKLKIGMLCHIHDIFRNTIFQIYLFLDFSTKRKCLNVAKLIENKKRTSGQNFISNSNWGTLNERNWNPR